MDAKKLIKILLLTICLVFALTVISDRLALSKGLIRFHVVAASDAQADQDLKLEVRDAIMASLQENMQSISDCDSAQAYLQANLSYIEEIANRTLKDLGSDHIATVTLQKEAFPTRKYDTFRLPAGVYESLRITIGPGKGENWWCVVFPDFCMEPVKVKTVAVGAGFSGPLSDAIAGENGYEMRFFFLELLGSVENFFCRG